VRRTLEQRADGRDALLRYVGISADGDRHCVFYHLVERLILEIKDRLAMPFFNFAGGKNETAGA
jgi:hypothetical protein